MSLIKPFNGIRPKKNLAKQVTSSNISYIDNYKPNKKLNFLNLLNATKINKSKKILKSLKDKNIIQEILSGLISTTLLDLEIKDFNFLISENTLSQMIKKNKNFPNLV